MKLGAGVKVQVPSGWQSIEPGPCSTKPWTRRTGCPSVSFARTLKVTGVFFDAWTLSIRMIDVNGAAAIGFARAA